MLEGYLRLLLGRGITSGQSAVFVVATQGAAAELAGSSSGGPAITAEEDAGHVCSRKAQILEALDVVVPPVAHPSGQVGREGEISPPAADEVLRGSNGA